MKNYEFKKAWKMFIVYVKMEKTVINAGDTEIEKQKFWKYEKRISITNIDINKIVVSNKVPLGKKDFKYFIGYKDAKIRPLCTFLLKMSAYNSDFGEIKYMSFLTKDDELLEKYNEIWEKVSKSI